MIIRHMSIVSNIQNQRGIAQIRVEHFYEIRYRSVRSETEWRSLAQVQAAPSRSIHNV